MTASMLPASWAHFIRREYLETFIREGGAATIKFCVPLEEEARAATWNALDQMGRDLRFLVVRLDASNTKVNAVDQMFFRIAEQVDWPGLAARVVDRLCQHSGYQLPDYSEKPFFEGVAERNEIEPNIIKVNLERALGREVFRRPELAKDFRIAMTQLCLAHLRGGDDGPIIARTLIEWLTGANPNVSPVKPYQIFNRITRTNARRLLESLLRWVVIAGCPGTLILIDLARLAVAKNPHDDNLFYTSAMLLDAFEVLREFIDLTERLANCFIAVFPDISFLDETGGRGMGRYWALKLRISDEVRARELVNPMASLVRLSVSAADVPSRVTDEPLSAIDCRAIEALRSGVPNEYAVRSMGSYQQRVEQLFEEKLSQVPDYLAAGKQVPGLLVSGDFGAGKSHLLEYLEDRALSEGFVCSRVVISKETPLYDPAKLYRAAIESAVVPGRAGHAIQEMALRLRDTDEYARFYRWCSGASSGVSEFFPATLLLHERLKNDPERIEAIVNFWSGEHFAVAEIRNGLRLVDASSMFRVRAVPARRLPLERFLFTARMVAGAGFKGWLLLIDEVELIGQYSFLQRARSYAELARWAGLLDGAHYPGILTVATITEDFDTRVLDERGKSDFSAVRLKLERGDREDYRDLAVRAKVGMRMIRRDAVALQPPDTERLEHTYDRLKDLHAKAYGWEPPDIGRATASIMTRMRTHVRRWINEWDLRRLYPEVPVSFEERELAPSYAEDVELEAAPERSDEH
jgi:hypothetical protein